MLVAITNSTASESSILPLYGGMIRTSIDIDPHAWMCDSLRKNDNTNSRCDVNDVKDSLQTWEISAAPLNPVVWAYNGTLAITMYNYTGSLYNVQPMPPDRDYEIKTAGAQFERGISAEELQSRLEKSL